MSEALDSHVDGAADEDAALVCYRQGEEARRTQRKEDAVASYAQALLHDARHKPSLLSLARTLAEMDRPSEAQHVLEQAERYYPGDVEVTALLLATGSDVVGAGQDPGLDRPTPVAAERAPDFAGASSGGRAPLPTGAMQSLIVPAPPAKPAKTDSYKRAMLLGGIAFPMVVATYVVVGLAVHFAPGLAAAAGAALLLAALGSLFFPANRSMAFKGMLHGMLWGVAVVLFAGLVSVIIAVGTAVSG
jgi:tetratricopeptide (TPR) repeat protein